jgi:hypothetical protein
LLATGCSSPYLLVEVSASVTNPLVTQLSVSVSQDGKTASFDAPATPATNLSFPTTLSVGLTTSVHGAVEVAVSALDGPATVVAYGQTSAQVEDGGGTVSVFLLDHCENGLRDAGETGLDCGGECDACVEGVPCSSGQTCTTGSCIAGRCALASAPPSWVSAPSLSVGRGSLAATLGADGNIYAAGGDYPSGAVSNVETLDAYDDAAAWVEATPLDMPHDGPAVVTGSDGLVYTLGGAEATTTMESYKPGASTWNQVTMPVGRGALAAVATTDGHIFAMGGGVGSNLLASVDVYAIASGTWNSDVSVPAMTTARFAFGGAQLADGRVIAIGGETPSGTVGSVEAYTATSGWMLVASLSEARKEHAAAMAPDGRVYAVGGTNGGDLASVEAYSSVANHWDAAASLTSARFNLAVSVGADGRLYAIGGQQSSGWLKSVEAYGPQVVLAVDHGATGGTLTLTGSNFAVSSHVSVFFAGAGVPLGGVLIGTGNADTTGALSSVSLQLPRVANGSYTIRAYDDRSRYPVTARFTVE